MEGLPVGWTQQFRLREARAEAEGEARGGPEVTAPVKGGCRGS